MVACEWISVITPQCTPCIFALLENAKMPKMPRVNIGIVLRELNKPLCKSARNAKGLQREKGRILESGKIPFEFLKRLCMLPTVVDAIIVTTVITVGKVNEKKGVQGYVSGFLFLRKATAETAVTAVTALCFSHCHRRSFQGGASLCLGITCNPKTLHNLITQ